LYEIFTIGKFKYLSSNAINKQSQKQNQNAKQQITAHLHRWID